MNTLLRSAVAVIVVSAACSAGAQPGNVQRCESKDGRVTYSNTQCPDGTVPVRKVNTEPPVSVDAKKAAQEQAKKDTAAAKQMDKERAQQESREQKQADERAKVQARAKERCDRAHRDLDRAKATRVQLDERATTVEKMQKADHEIGQREADVAKECAR